MPQATHVSSATFKSKTTLLIYSDFLNAEGEKTFTLTTTKTNSSIQETDFTFENTLVRISINRDCPEIQLAGLAVGPFEEAKEYEVEYWIANELERAGIARFREEELLDIRKLDKILWKEKVQQVRQVSHLQEDFYPRLRRFLNRLKKSANNSPEKNAEYRKAEGVARDIVNIRLRKIIALASSPEQTDQTLNDLAKEERTLYNQLYNIINEWKTGIMKESNEL